jgi:hypothetical protein
MKRKLKSVLAALITSVLILGPKVIYGQSEKAFIKKYLTELPENSVSNKLQKYRMTAIYTNRDLYGSFMNKTKITGDYTRGLENGFVTWNNVYISASNNFSGPFPIGTKQEYIENMKYVPSSKMMEAEAFKDFPASTEAVFAKNLVWDMMAIEGFAWDYSDSLKLNINYRIPEIKGEFDMADVGTYFHNEIQVVWTGISEINGELCALLEYRAIDNKIELSMEAIKSKGTEQYWGTIWISLKSRLIEFANMYAGSMQEIEVMGMKDKFLVKTIRVLEVSKIK